MDVWQEINWYAIQTKPCREDLAAVNIGRMGLEIFLPKIQQEKFIWGRPQSVLKPLFPNYLFAQFCPRAFLHLIRYARGVRRVISAGEVPLPVDESIIQIIRSHVGQGGLVTFGTRPLRPGDRVVVEEGPLKGLMGIFERELGGRERVVLLLEAIEFQARVLTEKRYLKAVAIST